MIHVLHILAGTTGTIRLQIVILALAARNFIWGSAISAVLTNQTAQTRVNKSNYTSTRFSRDETAEIFPDSGMRIYFGKLGQ